MDTPVAARSIWMSFPMPAFPALPANARVDVCVIGAGIAGLTTAYLLGKKGKKVLVIDDGPVAGGMSSRTTAHLSNAIDDRYEEIERLHGAEGAKLAAASHGAAIDAIEAIVQNEGIDCDFARVDGYLFLPPGGDPAELARELDAARRAGLAGVDWAQAAPLEGIDTGRCLRFPRQGQFHPLKYLAGLARAIVRDGNAIHCGEHAVQIEDGRLVLTASGRRIECQDVVVATNVPIVDRVKIHTKQAPYMTYVVAARVPRGSVEAALLWDTLDPYHYVRLDAPGGEILIAGGEDHKTGQADDPERRFANLEAWLRERFPSTGEIVARWSGQVMETHDGLAFAGRNPGDRNTYIATGDSGMGMTHGTIAGILITDLIHGVEVPWATLYDPSRITLKAAPTFARENANVALQYARHLESGELQRFEDVRAGSGAIVRHGMRRVAAWRDAGGELHTMSAVCTHLGCPVSWNHAEATWDCHCHGSRFHADGRVLSGPAIRALDPVEITSDPDVRNADAERGTRPTPPP